MTAGLAAVWGAGPGDTVESLQSGPDGAKMGNGDRNHTGCKMGREM